VWAIFRKEVRQFLNSLIAYIVIGVFLTGMGLLTWVFPDTSVLNYGYADLETLFTLGPFVYMFLIPAITMRMLAEEKKAGTLELLLTRPLTYSQIILGKYLAAFALVILSVIPTLVYYYSVYQLGNPVGNLDTPGIIGSYIGIILLGGVFTAYGILASSLSENQIVAFILSVFLCFFTYSGVSSLAGLFSGQTALYIEEMSLSYHYDALSRGLVDTRNLLFFVSSVVIALAFTYLKLNASLMSHKTLRMKTLRNVAGALLAVLCLNIIGANYFKRFDLTEEKRYTLRNSTEEMLSSLDQPLHIEVLLGTDLPTGFQRFQKAIIETIEEIGIYSNVKVTYSVNDPGAAATEPERRANYDLRMGQGLSATRIFANQDGQQTQKLIFPYVILTYGGRQGAVLMLKGSRGAPSEVKLNQSVEGIEFELAVGIQRLSAVNRKRVGIVRGHGELDSLSINGFVREMIQFYDLQPVDLRVEQEIRDFDAIVISAPQERFSREDKYKIDQYIMRGGKVLFLIDAMQVDMTKAGGQGTFALPRDLNLEDLFFRLGVRFESNYVLDVQNFGRYPVFSPDAEGTVTNLRWPFYFGAGNYTEHPITRNLDAIYTRFTGTIDTVAARGIKKTPLLFTSVNTKVIQAPALVSFEQIARENDPSAYQAGVQPIAYLLEGDFTSMFKNRPLPKQGVNTANFKGDGASTKVIVVSDGDIIGNEIIRGQPLDLGFNPFTEGNEAPMYANKDFLFNALAYLTDESGLITARNKEVRIRPLDRIKAQEERLKWQLINLVLPLVILVLFGLTRHLIRKRRYSRFNK